jgi:hypothetical protein
MDSYHHDALFPKASCWYESMSCFSASGSGKSGLQIVILNGPKTQKHDFLVIKGNKKTTHMDSYHHDALFPKASCWYESMSCFSASGLRYSGHCCCYCYWWLLRLGRLIHSVSSSLCSPLRFWTFPLRFFALPLRV